jgi:hypothetical protein
MRAPALLFLFYAAYAAASDYEPGYDTNTAVTLSAKVSSFSKGSLLTEHPLKDRRHTYFKVL